MVDRLSFDTTFLIDLQKEKKRGADGEAKQFLRDHSSAGMFLSAVALGEFAEGFSDVEDSNLLSLLTAVEILPIDRKVSFIYAQNARRLRGEGRLIGGNDLWIGSCSARYEIALVTRNGKHFRRIKGLQVIEY